MTITKIPIRPPSRTTQKRHGQHHRRSSHYAKPYWPYLPMIGIIAFGFVLNAWFGSLNRNVLSYATNISQSGLLRVTNQERLNNHETELSLNDKLTKAAEAKAADMATSNYWAHTSPAGKTPWTFIDASGYEYSSAGENLAYGFASSNDAVTGWMNSESHRANMLNQAFTEVGFGIINIGNYQGHGNQTLVVAMYGEPVSAASTIGSETPASTQDQDTLRAVAAKTGDKTTESNVSTSIPRISLVSSGTTSWAAFALSLTVSLGILIFLLRHSLIWHKVMVRGERFIVRHPMVDIGIVATVTLGAVLLQSSGIIK